MFVVGVKDSFSKNIAQGLSAEFIELDAHRFGDNELRPRILLDGKDLSGQDVLLISRAKDQEEFKPNQMLVQTLFTLKNLTGLGANVSVLMPYLFYQMQDKVFRPGEPKSAEYVLELLKQNGCKKVFVVSSHMQREEGKLNFGSIEAYNISGFPVLGEYLNTIGLDNPLVLGPDFTSGGDAEIVAKIVGGEASAIKGIRDKDTGEKSITEEHIGVLKGRDVLIVDDIVEGGGTMTNAIKLCKAHGAGRIVAACVHSVIVGKCKERLKENEVELVATNSVDSEYSRIGVEQVIVRYMNGV